ncbi:hypothetical protein Bhyg_09896 [Pseudolycoriella hygida]|uniref:Uncharacterized protein n=1 Tax=Pseudolycoriella hygida TaxID=35572 RepID=A0A9Q0RYP2_9DIPT|nr:hypothetical protein Bhyg_09896 [Pseudolycoriella hygida]
MKSHKKINQFTIMKPWDLPNRSDALYVYDLHNLEFLKNCTYKTKQKANPVHVGEKSVKKESASITTANGLFGANKSLN